MPSDGAWHAQQSVVILLPIALLRFESPFSGSGTIPARSRALRRNRDSTRAYLQGPQDSRHTNVFTLSGVEPTVPRLFRFDLIRTPRGVRDVGILVLGRQCLANDIGGASRVADRCRPRTSSLVSRQKSGSARVRNGQSSSSRLTDRKNWMGMDGKMETLNTPTVRITPESYH